MPSRVIPNDFVSRYELVKHLVGVHDGWRHPFGYTDEDEIINFPAADVKKVIHAHWIDENPEDLLDVRMRCSNCRTIHAPYAHWHYCPSCGATMDEVIEEREIT